MRSSGYQTGHSEWHNVEGKLANNGSYSEINQEFMSQAKKYGGHTGRGPLYPTDGRTSFVEQIGDGQAFDRLVEEAAKDRIVNWAATVTSAPVSHVPYSFDPTLIGASTAAMAIVGAHSASKSNKPTDKYKVAQDDKKTTDDKTKKTKMTKKKEEEQER